MDKGKLENLEKSLGYVFVNKQILVTALTLSKHANEKGLQSNERLEFLGDGIIRWVVSQYLFDIYPKASEGSLSIMRDKLVKAEPLNQLAFRLGVMHYVQGWDRSAKAMGSTIEALVGAMLIDGGFEIAKKFILDTVCSIKVDAEQDAKTKLQVLYQSETIKYITEKESFTPDHKPLFNSTVYVGMDMRGHGTGSTKSSAEQNAAEQALRNGAAENIK